MHVPWRSTFVLFRRSPHESRATPSAPASSGSGLRSRGRFPRHGTQSRVHSSVPRTARNFLSYLGADHPKVQRLDQLHREPHILGWMSRLRSQMPPLATASYLIRLICLRGICNELAWTEQLPELAHLIRREDMPRLPHRLPRPPRNRAGSTPAKGVPPPQRSGWQCLSVDSPHRHAHR